MKEGKLNVLIGGPAGAGVEKSGETLTLSFVRGGYHVFANVEHMSQIRHGNNFLRLRIDEEFQESHIEEIDAVIALDRKTIEDHIDEVSEGGVIIFDNQVVKLPEDFDTKGIKMLDVPLRELASNELKNPVMANIISLGIVCGLADFDVALIQEVLEKIFAKKGEEIIELNKKAAKMGYDMAKEQWAGEFPVTMPRKEPLNKMFLMGNDALSIGALKAGVKFVGEYPMTPSSSVLHFMARWAEKYEVVVKHTEDEIAACNSIIGAGFAGARAIAATSGGGFALMGEAIGLAGMNEVPIVLVNVMRPGPATGLPTRSDQGDLRQVIHAGQGDPIKIVLLPGGVHECFYMGFEAFNLAEKYQLPVIVCYDKHLGEGYFTVEDFDQTGLEVKRGKLLIQEELDKIDDFKRFERTEDGISPRSIPGMKGGIHRATSDEHNEYGDICEEAENRKLMVHKRMKKIELALADCPKPELIGGEDAEMTFVTWGSCKPICKEAIEILAKQGTKANMIQIKTAFPFHTEEMKSLLAKCKRPIVVEHNAGAQMRGLIAEHTGIIIEDTILRYDGRPMTAKYVIDRINK